MAQRIPIEENTVAPPLFILFFYTEDTKMDIAQFAPQLGTAGVFAVFAWKLYNDMREDSRRREDAIKSEHADRLKESKDREEKLIKHLDKQSDINREVSLTLKQIHERLCDIEERGGKA